MTQPDHTSKLDHTSKRENTPQMETETTAPALIAVAWLVVLVPLAWGVWETLTKVAQLF